jgi:hypothetical protein
MPLLARALTGVVLAGLVAALARRANSLSISGAWAAAV